MMSRQLHRKNKVVTLTVIHIILVAVSQGLVILPCSDMVCWLALCVLALGWPNMQAYFWNNRRCSETSIIPGIIGQNAGI